VRCITFFQQEDSRTIKVVCRYQQFRAVKAAEHSPRRPVMTLFSEQIYKRRGPRSEDSSTQ
jgi:hypothetical protein